MGGAARWSSTAVWLPLACLGLLPLLLPSALETIARSARHPGSRSALSERGSARELLVGVPGVPGVPSLPAEVPPRAETEVPGESSSADPAPDALLAGIQPAADEGLVERATGRQPERSEAPLLLEQDEAGL